MHAPAHTLRMRAPDFGEALRAHGGRHRLSAPPRSRVSLGERVRIEVSFGPMADEVDLFGEVHSGEDSELEVVIDADSEAQLTYVVAVLGGGREAAARRHRRLPSSLPVKWGNEQLRHDSRLVDISTGGAFIAYPGDLPPVGEQVIVQIRTGDLNATLRVESTVTWIRGPRRVADSGPLGKAGRSGDPGPRGFGVCFRISDAELANRLKDVVREHESAFAQA